MHGLGYIYKTTNKVNGRIYIGQKSGTFDPGYLGSGWILDKALRKYGRENFKLEVIWYASTKEMLDAFEIKNIAEYRKVFGSEFLYNISAGGSGLRRPCPDEVKKKIGVANSGSKPHRVGEKRSEETKAKMVEAWKTRRPFSAKTREKMRKAHLGLKHKPEEIEKIRTARLNDPQSTRDKKRAFRLGRKHTPEEISAMKARWAKMRERLALQSAK